MSAGVIAASFVDSILDGLGGLPSSFVNYTTNNYFVEAPTIPSTTQEGDWLVLIIANTNGNLTADPDWAPYLEEAIAGSSGGSEQTWLYVKPAVAGEPATTFATTDPFTRWVMMSYRGGGKPLLLASSEIVTGVGTNSGLPMTSMTGVPYNGKLLHIIALAADADPNSMSAISGATQVASGMNASNGYLGIKAAEETVVAGDVVSRTSTYGGATATYVSYTLLFPTDVTKTKWPRIKAAGGTNGNAASHSVSIPASQIDEGDLVIGLCWKTAAGISTKPSVLTDLIPITALPAYGFYTAGIHCGFKVADATEAASGMTLTWTTGSQVGGCLYVVIKDVNTSSPIATNGAPVQQNVNIPAAVAPVGEAAAAIFIGAGSSGGSAQGQMASAGTWTRIRVNGGDNYGFGFITSTAAIEPGGSTGPEARQISPGGDGPSYLGQAVLLRPAA